jgi:hypothetical protein
MACGLFIHYVDQSLRKGGQKRFQWPPVALASMPYWPQWDGLRAKEASLRCALFLSVNGKCVQTCNARGYATKGGEIR